MTRLTRKRHRRIGRLLSVALLVQFEDLFGVCLIQFVVNVPLELPKCARCGRLLATDAEKLTMLCADVVACVKVVDANWPESAEGFYASMAAPRDGDQGEGWEGE